MPRLMQAVPCQYCGDIFQARADHVRKGWGRFCSVQHKQAAQCVPPQERFWSKVDTSGGPETCWPWLAARNKKGYGIFTDEGRQWIAAHIFSYKLHYGFVPDSLCVLHRCDNPPCVNPSHLFLGTRIDNGIDKQKKDRQAKGEDIWTNKLTNQDVLAIRSLLARVYWHGMYRQVGRLFGVDGSLIPKIGQRQIWKHVP